MLNLEHLKIIREALVKLSGREKLEEWCVTASFFLLDFLKEGKVVAGIFDDGYDTKNPNHCWFVKDNLIIDLTATQFDIKEKIYITNIINPKYIPIKEFNNYNQEEFSLFWGAYYQLPTKETFDELKNIISVRGL